MRRRGPQAPPGCDDDGAVTYRKVFLAIAATALVAGCGGSSDARVAGNKFPENERQNFLAGCEDNGGRVSACACILTAVEQRWSLDEFEAIVKRIEAGGQVPAEFSQLSVDCARPA